MKNIFLGMFIGILISLFGMMMVRLIKRKKYKSLLKEYDNFEPLINSLVEKNIIKNGIKYLINIERRCIYVFVKNELRVYAYENINKKIISEIDIIEIPENIINILEKYINWNIHCGINSIYASSIRFIH